MNEKITLYIMSDRGVRMKQYSLSKLTLLTISLIFFGVSSISGYFLIDYFRLKKTFHSSKTLLTHIADQDKLIETHNQQIETFAREINFLKSKIVNLNEFEKKIRIIANIEKSPDEEGLFGIGGSIPDDINPNVKIETTHDSLMREMHDQIGNLGIAFNKQEQGFDNLLNGLKAKQNLLLCTPAIRPSDGWLTSNFGYRKSPYTGHQEFHKALDIANKIGTSIRATANGTVISAGDKGFLGKVITIDHGFGVITKYGHLSKISVKVGAVVKRGEVIGQMGNTGKSTGPHVHYEVVLNGVPVNPTGYILN